VNGGAPDARRPIRRLLPATIERIAAGEVVERPASVVKELVENSIDAGATTIAVRLDGGGLDRIAVADDGVGIPAEELELAVERHATSKLRPDDPLESIEALGFRGEALAAIGAVARLRLVSRPPARESAEGISVVGGQVVGRFSDARAVGTTVTVEELFFNTPARRKFLKGGASEQVEVVRTVERLYLARPSIAFRVESGGLEILLCPPTTRLADAAARVLGAEFLAANFALRADLPGGRLFGAIGLPAVAAPTSGLLFASVNGRAIVSRSLTQAIRAAFGDALPRARFPVGVLHLELDPAVVDVNVHPTKREVRFAAEPALADAVRRAVRAALLGRPAPADVRVRSSPEFPAELPGSSDEASGILPETASRNAAQRTLDPVASSVRPSVAPAASGARRFELLGVLDALYWVAATDDGLTLVDQHAASERLLYEQLRRDGRLARQELVDPITVRLTAAEASAWTAHESHVRASGFDLDAFGPDTFRLRSVPTYRGRSARADDLRDLLRELGEGGRPTLPDGLEERAAASLACHAAVRAGDAIAESDLLAVLRALDQLPERVRSCPHGRPIYVRIPRSRLDGWFLRRGA